MQVQQEQPTAQHMFRTNKSLRRFRSADEGALLDAIGEDDVLVPSKPRRHKSADDLDAWMWGVDSDDDDDITLSSTGISDENDSPFLGDADSDEGDDSSFADERQFSAIMEGMSVFDIDFDDDEEEGDDDKDTSPHRPGNIDRNANSLASFGSSMTAAQQAHPGRFVTPVNSFLGSTNYNIPLTCAPPVPHDRIVVEPHRFIPVDLCAPLTQKSLGHRNHDLQRMTKKHDALVTPTTSFTSCGSSSVEKELLWYGQQQQHLIQPPPPLHAAHGTRATISLTFPLLESNNDDDDHGMSSSMPPPLPRMIGLTRKSSICRLVTNHHNDDEKNHKSHTTTNHN